MVARSAAGAVHEITVVRGEGTKLEFTSTPRTELVDRLPQRAGVRR